MDFGWLSIFFIKTDTIIYDLTDKLYSNLVIHICSNLVTLYLLGEWINKPYV